MRVDIVESAVERAWSKLKLTYTERVEAKAGSKRSSRSSLGEKDVTGRRSRLNATRCCLNEQRCSLRTTRTQFPSTC